MSKQQIVSGIALLAVGAVGGVGFSGMDQVKLCHATGSANNPFVIIQVSAKSLNGHDRTGDFIAPSGAVSGKDCVQTSPPPIGVGTL